MILQRLLTHLHFSSQGRVLFHATPREVTAWDVEQGRPLYTCPGQWIGKSRDDRTFLTCRAPDTFSAWQVETGQELALQAVSPEAYAPHERFVVYGFPWPYELVKPAELCIRDAFGIQSPQTIQVPRRLGDWPDSWAMVPNRRQVVVTMYGDSGGHDWAYGMFVDLETQTVLRLGRSASCRFFVARFSPPPFYFSIAHDLLISASHGEFHLYDLKTRERVRQIRVRDSFGFILALHPQQADYAVTNVEPISAARMGQRSIEQLQIRADATWHDTQNLLPESGSVKDLAFHPNGQILACLLQDGSIHLWDIETRTRVATWPPWAAC